MENAIIEAASEDDKSSVDEIVQDPAEFVPHVVLRTFFENLSELPAAEVTASQKNFSSGAL
ncbi:MAG: hypothetical protein AAF184_24735 [Pseudomonadota bacterium]